VFLITAGLFSFRGDTMALTLTCVAASLLITC
jgi:hypothetical protein